MNTFNIFLVLITIVSFLLIIAVMVQNPKGGGLSGTFGGSSQMGGVQNTNEFLNKSTWTLAGVLALLIILSSMSFGSNNPTASKVVDENAPAPVTTPVPATPAEGSNTATPQPAK